MSIDIQNIRVLSTAEKFSLTGLIVGIGIGLLYILPPEFLGFNPTAFAWIMPLIVSLIVILSNASKITFPFKIWIPWILWTGLYMLVSHEKNALQRTVMLHTGVVIGIAFSTFRPNLYFLDIFAKGMRAYFFAILLLGFFSMSLGFNSTSDSNAGNFAAGATTATLLSVWFVGRYSIGYSKSLFNYVLLGLVPYLCNTRMGMFAVAMVFPLTFGPIGLKKRLASLLVIICLGLLAFKTEHVQSKMFYSGHGDYSDLFQGIANLVSGSESDTSASDFATNGRKSIAIALEDGLRAHYWMGNGANTTEAISFEVAGVTHPHNDWLRIQYEYGIVGVIIFICTLILQIRSAYKVKQYAPPKIAIPYYCLGAGAFIPMIFFMLSDNILLYVGWYGNVQFAALGLYYGITSFYKNASK